MARDKLTVCEQELLKAFVHLVSISSNFLFSYLLLSPQQAIWCQFNTVRCVSTNPHWQQPSNRLICQCHLHWTVNN